MRPVTSFMVMSLLVLGCGGTPVGSDAGAANDTGTGTDTGPTGPILADGAYTATTNGIVDDTCGTLAADAMFGAADATVMFSTPTEFGVQYPGFVVGYTCSVDEMGSVTCGGYGQDLLPRAEAVLHLDVAVVDFVATSHTSFDQAELATIDCMGANCGALATDLRTTFPCSMRIEESFAQ